MAPQNMVSIGDHLRAWRERNRLSQLHCALEADISQRHLSFLETGRSRPSRDMIIHLADRLNIPLRDRNAALLAASMLANQDPVLRQALADFRARQTEQVLAQPDPRVELSGGNA